MSRRIRSLLSLAGLAVLATVAGCGDPTAGPATTGGAKQLSGRWVSSRNDLSPAGWHQSSLTFASGGRFASENHMYGLYGGQGRDDLSAFTRVEGTYRAEGDRLIFELQRLVWWDRFYGAQSAERIEEPYPWGSLFDDARYSISFVRLTLSYKVYPADAPVPVIAKFVRDR